MVSVQSLPYNVCVDIAIANLGELEADRSYVYLHGRLHGFLTRLLLFIMRMWLLPSIEREYIGVHVHVRKIGTFVWTVGIICQIWSKAT